MKISSRTPVKVKRRSCIVWMMEDPVSRRRDSGLDGTVKEENITDGNQDASSIKRNFSKKNVEDDTDIAPSQLLKKVKVNSEQEHIMKTDAHSLNQHVDKSGARTNVSVITQKDDVVNCSFSKKVCSSFGCGNDFNENQSESSSSSYSTVAADSSTFTSSGSASSDGMTPKIFYYSRHTTLRLRSSSTNGHSPLLARQLRF